MEEKMFCFWQIQKASQQTEAAISQVVQIFVSGAVRMWQLITKETGGGHFVSNSTV